MPSARGAPSSIGSASWTSGPGSIGFPSPENSTKRGKTHDLPFFDSPVPHASESRPVHFGDPRERRDVRDRRGTASTAPAIGDPEEGAVKQSAKRSRGMLSVVPKTS